MTRQSRKLDQPARPILLSLSPDLTSEYWDKLHDPVPQNILELSDAMYRDQVIDAWKNASRLLYSIPIWLSYYHSIFPRILVYLTRVLIHRPKRKIAAECLFESHIRSCLESLRLMHVAIPMIQENDERFLMNSISPFSISGKGKEWKGRFESLPRRPTRRDLATCK